MRSIALISFAVLFIDRASKCIAVRYFKHHFSYNTSIPVIPNIFHITLVYNKGAAFGLFQNATFLFILVSAISISIILFFVFFRPQYIKSIWIRLSLSFILAGAFGNLVDRIKFGCVIDFLDFRIWPVFNFADSAITVGLFILIIQLFKKQNASRTF